MPTYKILIGTELGVYITDTYAAGATHWQRDNNSPNTRVNQIKYRGVDNMLFMATNGRGLWRSDMFSAKQVWYGSLLPQLNPNTTKITFSDFSSNF